MLSYDLAILPEALQYLHIHLGTWKCHEYFEQLRGDEMVPYMAPSHCKFIHLTLEDKSDLFIK